MKHHRRKKRDSDVKENLDVTAKLNSPGSENALTKENSTTPITVPFAVEGNQAIKEDMAPVIEKVTKTFDNIEFPTILSQLDNPNPIRTTEVGMGIKIIEQGDYILTPDSEETEQILSQMENNDSGKFSKTKYWNQPGIEIENINQGNSLVEINDRLQDIVKKLGDIELYLRKMELIIKETNRLG